MSEAKTQRIASSSTFEQAHRCLEIIDEALREAGLGLEQVVRTRMFIVDAGDSELPE